MARREMDIKALKEEEIGIVAYDLRDNDEELSGSLNFLKSRYKEYLISEIKKEECRGIRNISSI